MNRRGFLKLFSAVPVGAVLAEPIARTIFLPPRNGWPVSNMSRYLTSKDAWFLYTNASPVELTEASLERMLEQIRTIDKVAIQPRFIISPAEFNRLMRPGSETFWKGVYAEHPEEWSRIYG